LSALQVPADQQEEFLRHACSRWREIGFAPTGDSYCPIDKVRHVNSEYIPATLRRRNNVAALPKESGSQKVAALFGVQTVETK
jgi:hypothetical protein